MTPACPRLLDMINAFVLLRFWTRTPRGFKRYRSYSIIIIIIIIIIEMIQPCAKIVAKRTKTQKAENIIAYKSSNEEAQRNNREQDPRENM